MRAPNFTVRLATSDADVLAAQRLRYRVFVEELGSDGPLVDHEGRFERDRFDAVSHHLVLIDEAREADGHEHVVGVYRLLDEAGASAAGQFYSEGEYDLGKLKSSGRRLLELGRSCLHPAYRGGAGMFYLWNALAEVIRERQIEVLFGVASFHGTEATKLAAPLSLLRHRHLAPETLRVTAREENFQRMDLIAEAELDRRAAMLDVPALIKAYLRLGGVVGEGAFVDHAFNTTDVCLILDTQAMPPRSRAIYEGRI
ncbi:GNAT family N-acetyltransferase [Lentibacter sp. XHP0401]|uniref:GNAT family N-acetyltransferase n=1 Tax=Lentibacter sp. XHP0401 TaxID=2984334 RepID=UPI0021E81FF3|nr:GNAT family N-acyltransferase [Lentibacter sp. XHP0401]MCV2892026.1 GNAT family N-acetyltransferase [Lentibacter sp. XHP0401]